MLQNFNWLDIIIALLLTMAMFQGLRSGLLKTLFSIVGIAAAILMAFKYYAPLSTFVLSYIPLPHTLTDLLSFMVIFTSVSLAIHYIGHLISSIIHFSFFRFLDKIGGIFAGLILGLIFCGIILVLLTSFPLFEGMQEHLEASVLAPPLTEVTSSLYKEFSNVLPVKLPEIFFYPEEMSDYFHSLSRLIEQQGINFSSLDGSTCFVCGNAVIFNGYHNNGKDSISPKFTCSHCGRTSDGCQTYEGYHVMYEQCPVELGDIGYRFDCGIWTNHSYHRPLGPCTVCTGND